MLAVFSPEVELVKLLEVNYIMPEQTFILDKAKRKAKIEQTVRGFLNVLDENRLEMEDGLVAWNMLGFTMFQNSFPNESHTAIQQRMIEYSKTVFASRQKN